MLLVGSEDGVGMEVHGPAGACCNWCMAQQQVWGMLRMRMAVLRECGKRAVAHPPGAHPAEAKESKAVDICC